VFAVARGLNPAELLPRAEAALVIGMAHTGKTRGMIIVERDDVAYLAIVREGRFDSAELIDTGRALFGPLKVTHTPIRLLPEGGYTSKP